MKRIILLALVVGLAGCESKEAKEQRLNSIGYDYVQKIVKDSLTDPQSAQFKNQVGYCGEVNSKNKMGGYGDFQKFAVLNSKLVVFENEANQANGQFPKVWKETCAADFKFGNDSLIAPNFKLPDPEYKKAQYRFGANFATATPSSIVVGDGKYIYPVFQIHCKDKQTTFNLYSMNTISYKMDNTVAIETEDKALELLDIEGDDNGYQSFGASNQLLNALKTAQTLKISFQTRSGGHTLQEYNLSELRKGMMAQKNSCEWDKFQI